MKSKKNALSIFSITFAIMLLILSFGVVACGSRNVIYNSDVVLVDVCGKSSIDINSYVSAEILDVTSKKNKLTYKLTSVATGTVFTFNSSTVNLSKIHKEYYKVEIFSRNNLLAVTNIDLYDAEDGVVWCEWSEYALKACIFLSSAPEHEGGTEDEVRFEYVDQSFGSEDVLMIGDALIYQPGINGDWFNYISVKPFHSKKYYETYAKYGVLSISYVRKAVYSYDNKEFRPEENPKYANFSDGEYAAPGYEINTRIFGVKENSRLGAKLNEWQTMDYQMVQINEHYDKIGDKVKGGPYWYLIGTSHRDQAFRITFYISSIEVIPA